MTEEKTTVRQFPPPVKRGDLAAWWGGRRAARCGLSWHEYGSNRLGIYRATMPQDIVLPSIIEITPDGIATVANPEWSADPLSRAIADPAGVDMADEGVETAELRWIRSQAAMKAAQILRDLRAAEEDCARLEHKLQLAADEVEVRKTSLQQDLADGRLLPGATAARGDSRGDRPRLPGLRGAVALLSAAAALVLAEAWQFALPYMDAIGIDRGALGLEFQRDPASVVFAVLFAVCAAMGVLACAHFVVNAVLACRPAEDPDASPRISRGRIAFQLGLAATFGLVLALGIGAISDMRHETSAGASDLLSVTAGGASGGVATYAFVIVSLLATVAATAFLHWGLTRLQARDAARAAISAWENNQEFHQQDRERHDELVAAAVREHAELERLREAARDRLRQVGERAQALERTMREKLETRRRFAAAWVNSVVAALSRDRHAYLIAARPLEGAWSDSDAEVVRLETARDMSGNGGWGDARSEEVSA